MVDVVFGEIRDVTSETSSGVAWTSCAAPAKTGAFLSASTFPPSGANALPPHGGVETGRKRGVHSLSVDLVLLRIFRPQFSLVAGGASPCRVSPAHLSSIAAASKLRVTGTQTEDMAFYLRTSFRVLFSWVHQLDAWLGHFSNVGHDDG
jgi:hypothetical protein